MKRWKRIFRNVAVVFLSTGTILSVPVTACAHVEETAEEAQAEQGENLGNTTLQSEKEETVPEQKEGSEEEQTGENQKKDVNAFSTAGNGQVQDSIGDSSTKEFYTIKTKNNNTYYLVIDHANNIDNVYMLSEIDENDLKQFLSEDTTSGISSSVTAGIVLDEEQKKSKNINSVESEQDKKEVKKTHKITLQDLTEKIDSMNKEEFILQIDLESEDADE